MKAPIDYGDLLPYTPRDPEAALHYIVDLDGTVCLRGDRCPYDESKVGNDAANRPVLTVLEALARAGHGVIFMSGRKESCMDDTVAWLKRHWRHGFYGPFMRPVGDGRADWMVKYSLFNANVRENFNIGGVFDDRDQVVGMWRRIGLTVFQVADGAF